VHRKYIPIYIQQDATLHSLYLETALHVSGGTSTHHQERITTVSTASCWIYIGILLGAHPVLHISRIRVNTVTGSWAGQLSDSGFGSRLTPVVLLISTESRRILRPAQPSSQWITGGKAAGA
jgi:hypothetical protein